LLAIVFSGRSLASLYRLAAVRRSRQPAALRGAVRAAPVVDTVVATVLPGRLIEGADVAALPLDTALGAAVAGVAAGSAVLFVGLEIFAGTGAALETGGVAPPVATAAVIPVGLRVDALVAADFPAVGAALPRDAPAPSAAHALRCVAAHMRIVAAVVAAAGMFSRRAERP